MRSFLLHAALALGFLLGVLPAQAQAPRTIAYQGHLTSNAGVPVNGGATISGAQVTGTLTGAAVPGAEPLGGQIHVSRAGQWVVTGLQGAVFQ